MNWTSLPSKDTITKTLKALEENGFNPIFVETAEEAKAKVLELLPKDAEVMTMSSATLQAIGLSQSINESGQYDSVRAKLMGMDRKTQGSDMRKLGSAPDYSIGSVNAVTEDGHALIASRTGSQLPAYAYGAEKVIWVVGAQKIVATIDEAQKRIFEYVLPLEGERANKAYNTTGGSKVDKLLTYYRDEVPGRITLILVNQPLGF